MIDQIKDEVLSKIARCKGKDELTQEQKTQILKTFSDKNDAKNNINFFNNIITYLINPNWNRVTNSWQYPSIVANKKWLFEKHNIDPSDFVSSDFWILVNELSRVWSNTMLSRDEKIQKMEEIQDKLLEKKLAVISGLADIYIKLREDWATHDQARNFYRKWQGKPISS